MSAERQYRLNGFDEQWRREEAWPGDPSRGICLYFTSDTPFQEKTFPVGEFPRMERFTACWRRDSTCWMHSRTGEQAGQVPMETQYLIARQEEQYLILIPLVDKGFRCCLEGVPGKGLFLVAESRDPGCLATEICGLFAAFGKDPYRLVEEAFQTLAARLGSFQLKKNKRLPDFVRYYGFCSYNAFYNHITHEKLTGLMQSYRDQGILPRYMILDAGWQQADKENRMTSFEADLEKFPHGLAGFRKDLTELGLEQLLVWHTFSGYWSGMSPKVYGEYGVKERNYLIPPRHLAAGNGDRPESGPDEGLDTTGVGKRFYPMNLTKKQTGLSYMQFGRLMHDFHYYLARQGVDGVKIDAMTWIEGYATGQGGMDALAGTMMQALETSAIDCLNGNLLCCSSCSNSILFHSGAGTTVTRTSTDFFPNRPETHGEHILTNVHTSFWMGQVIYPDWDMFQSGHPAGLFHAAARAISGGPVYTTDEPGKEDPEVIRKVRLGDGRVALCTHHARICEDSLFVDPFLNRDLVKIFNFNPCGQVIGIFNCSWPGAGENAEGNGAAAGLVAGATGSAAEAAASPDMHISGRIRLKDVHGLPDGQYAVHINGETGITLMDADSGMDITLPPLGFRICTLAPVTDGFAPIGLIKMFNPGGTVAEVYRNRTGASVFVKLLDGGEFLAYSTSRPRQVLLSGMELAWDYDPETGSLRVQVPGQGDHLLEIFQPV